MAYYTLKSYKLNVSPWDIFRALKEQKNCFFLDSSLNADYSLGRYSFLGVNPFYVLESSNPFSQLKKLLEKYRQDVPGLKIPFLGGALGYLAYDLGFCLENGLQKRVADDLRIPGAVFAFYNTVIIVDNIKKGFSIFCVGFPETKWSLQKSLAESTLKRVYNLISRSITPKKQNDKLYTTTIKSNFSKKNYLAAIKKAKQYIKDGDIYQVNLSQRLEAKTQLSGFEIYRRLRQISPSYFGSYFDAGDFQILSSSPESFLSLKANTVTTRPMKGTRERGETKEQDFALRQQLLKSPKDKAELAMIVDLERNDLGRVCAYDSIKVTSLRQLEKYNTVYQATAVIEGKLYKNKDRLDLLRACFPGGSITGCPKIRAMEIIEELEPSRRGVYTGSLGYLSFSGDMDFNILIRTILKKRGQLYFSVGGGIVADSDPEAEYEETLVKAKAMIEAISA